MFFNSNLYVAAATVLPVLFVAVMPGQLLAKYAFWVKELRSRQIRRVTKGGAGTPSHRLTAVVRFHDLLILPVA